MAIIPIYIYELAPKQVVGSYGVFTQLFVVVALVTSYGLGLILQALNASPFVFYRIMVSVNALLIIVQSILLLVGFIPESPNSLIRKNRTEEAKAVVALFTKPEFVDEAYDEKVLEVLVDRKEEDPSEVFPKKQEKINYAFRAFLLGFELPFMQQLTGINGVVTQANTIVAAVIPDLAQYVSIIINCVQLVATLAAVLVLSRFGRRPLTLFGNLGLGIIDILLAVLFLFPGWAPSGYIILGFLIIYMIVYGVSLGPVVWLYVPEIIPAKVVPLATMMNWFGTSLCVILTPIITNLNGGNPYPIFFAFGAITLLFFVMNYSLMVETKGRTNKQIALLFFKEQ
jgi:MFS transporter, SP family, sugar:H+ symporter